MSRRSAAVVLSFCITAASALGGGTIPGEVAQQIDAMSFYDFLENDLFTFSGANKGLGGAQHDPCRDMIASRMTQFGLDVELQPFAYGGRTNHNVIGTQTGTKFPDSYIIVSAHYDTVNNPGADDDASGVAAVLEIARVLSRYDTDYTIKYIAWDREEQGKIGSAFYANQHNGDDILAVVQLDMIAHDVGLNTQDVWGDANSASLRADLQTFATLFGNGITINYAGNATFSDHAPFAQRGYEAVVFVEHNFTQFGCYHSPCDTVDTMDYIHAEFATDLARSVAAYLADKAGARSRCGGDADGDGLVDFADLNAVLSAFGTTGYSMVADANCDNTVSFADLNLILSRFGTPWE